MSRCPGWAAELDLALNVEEGGVLVCADRGLELQVMSVERFTVDLAPELEEDWCE